MSPNVAASIKARLLNQARLHGEEFELTLTRFAAERLLYRLGASAVRDRCILKGASLLSVWLPDPYRATRDIDMLAWGPADNAAIRALVGEMCAVPCPEDGLQFDLAELVVDPIHAAEAYVGQRARFRAHLGSARIQVQIDFGVGDALTVLPEEIEYPTMLVALPAPRVRAYRRETTVAEKFAAMVSLDTRNSRMKDFHDVWALSGGCAFDGAILREAIAGCFERRAAAWTSEPPGCLTADFYGSPELQSRWTRHLHAGTVLVPPPARFDVIGERVIRFLGPVRGSLVDGSAFVGRWEPGGPWATDGASTR